MIEVTLIGAYIKDKGLKESLGGESARDRRTEINILLHLFSLLRFS